MTRSCLPTTGTPGYGCRGGFETRPYNAGSRPDLFISPMMTAGLRGQLQGIDSPDTTMRELLVAKLDGDGRVMEIHDRLLAAFGPQGWWPAEGDFEMVIGAILTQNTAWVNVEKAIANLKAVRVLEPAALEAVDERELASLIRPSGYFNTKARKLKAFSAHLRERHGGSLDSLFHVKLPELREELLGIWGVGPETADSIILYGARRPLFVVDAYTTRIFGRLGLTPLDAPYAELQRFFMERLAASVPLFQEYHALLVAQGKDICRTRPRCPQCPIAGLCERKGLGSDR